MIRIISVSIAFLLLTVGVVNASNENYNISLKIFNKDGELVKSAYQIATGNGFYQETHSKPYFITECEVESEKEIKVFTSKQFVEGFQYSLDLNNSLLSFTEFRIDDKDFSKYNKENCFNDEVLQISQEVKLPINIGDVLGTEHQLPSGRVLKVLVAK